jgi:putative hydrolase of the HAD superfamily
MIEAVIWDMGGIFNRYFTEVIVGIGLEKGWPLGRIPLGPHGPMPDPDYEAMTEGLIDESTYLQIVRDSLEANGIDFDPVTDIDWPSQERPETWDAIKKIHASSLRQMILTNDASKWLGERWWETWQPIGYFDAVVDVATLGVRKPDPQTYLAAAAALSLPPPVCIFVDDMAVNCRGAEAAGMESLLFDITKSELSIGSLLERIELP